MSDPATLLPPNASDTERVIEAASARSSGVPVPIRHLWNAATCPVSALPFLAWAFSVDDWDSDWPEEEKRAVIAASVAIHRIKGTPAGVKLALSAAGYGDAELTERFGFYHNGTVMRDGSIDREPPDHWAEYRVRLSRPITILQAAQVRSILASVAPARAHLKGLFYLEALHLYDAKLARNGTFTRGVA